MRSWESATQSEISKYINKAAVLVDGGYVNCEVEKLAKKMFEKDAYNYQNDIESYSHPSQPSRNEGK